VILAGGAPAGAHAGHGVSCVYGRVDGKAGGGDQPSSVEFGAGGGQVLLSLADVGVHL
jgi:hypothetical protein